MEIEEQLFDSLLKALGSAPAARARKALPAVKLPLWKVREFVQALEGRDNQTTVRISEQPDGRHAIETCTIVWESTDEPLPDSTEGKL